MQFSKVTLNEAQKQSKCNSFAIHKTMRATVVHVSRYDFTTDDNKHLTGCKITFLGDAVSTSTAKGREAVTASAPIAVFDRFSQVPAEYDLDVTFKRSPEGQPVLKVRDAMILASAAK